MGPLLFVGGEVGGGFAVDAPLVLVLEHVVVVGWVNRAAAGASSVGVVGGGNQGERCVLACSTGFGRGSPTDFLVEFHPAPFGKECVVLIAPGLEGGSG